MTEFILYDDLDPGCLESGIIRFDGRFYGALWERCAARSLEVVADVHTHPAGAFQSESDRAHPMIGVRGHVALVLPNFARAPVQKETIGMFSYRGSREWDEVATSDRSDFLFIGPW